MKEVQIVYRAGKDYLAPHSDTPSSADVKGLCNFHQYPQWKGNEFHELSKEPDVGFLNLLNSFANSERITH